MSLQEIERRKPVWLAISEFYLDTDLDSDDLNRVINVFTESGYCLKELIDIDYYEVKPIVGGNLWSTAGVWAGFDEEWLWKEIINRTYNKKRRNNIFIKYHRLWLEKRPFSYWKKIKQIGRIK